MITAKSRQAAFLYDLNALLRTYGAVLEVTDDGKPYGQHIGIATIWMPTRRTGTEKVTAESVEFRLPSYMDGRDENE